MSLKAVRLDSDVRRKLMWYSIFGGVFITFLAIALRSCGIYRPVPYLTYFGSYLMQAFFQRFLEWIPWKYADNLISELLLFFVLNVLGYAFLIFLLLRIFFPDRSGELPPLTGKKLQSISAAEAESLPRLDGSMLDQNCCPRREPMPTDEVFLKHIATRPN